MLDLPDIGDTVTTAAAMVLCRHFGLELQAGRISANPFAYREWVFDGCSCLPDELMGLFAGCEWTDITYKCCLPHDLRYGYGEPGNEKERKLADSYFYWDLVEKAKMQKWLAAAFLKAVRIGGAEVFGLSFSWGFANREKE